MPVRLPPSAGKELLAMSLWRSLAILTLVLLLTACASHYRVTTHEGQIYDTMGKPSYDEDAKIYQFKGLDGKTVILNQRDIKEIKELPK